MKIFKECEHLSTMTIGGCHLDTKAFCEQKDFIFKKEEIAIADGHLIEHTLTKKTELSIRSDLTLKDLYEIMTPFVKTLTIESGKELNLFKTTIEFLDILRSYESLITIKVKNLQLDDHILWDQKRYTVEKDVFGADCYMVMYTLTESDEYSSRKKSLGF